MTTCLIVSDSFKGTLSSLEICRIAEEVVPAVIPDGRAIALPMADGGEGPVPSPAGQFAPPMAASAAAP